MRNEDLRDELSAFLDGELSAEERERLEQSLAQSPELQAELGQFKQVDALYRGLPQAEAPESLEARIRAARQRRPGPVRLQFRRGTRYERKSSWPLLAAAAAVLVVMVMVFTQMQQMQRTMHLASEAEPDRAHGTPETPAAARVGLQAGEFEISADTPQPDVMTQEVAVEPSERPAEASDDMPQFEPRAVPDGDFAGAAPESEVRRREQAVAMPMMERAPSAPPPAAAEPDVPEATAEIERGGGGFGGPMPEGFRESLAGGGLGGMGHGGFGGPGGGPARGPASEDGPQAVETPPPLSMQRPQAPGMDRPAAPQTLPSAVPGDVADKAEPYSADISSVPMSAQPPETGPPAEPLLIVGPRTLGLAGGRWEELRYHGEDTVRLSRNEAEWRMLREREPQLAPLDTVRTAVVFQADGIWYELEPYEPIAR